MNFSRFTILTLALSLLLSACVPGSATSAAPTSIAAAYLTTDYIDAASLRNQLAFGTLKLSDTANAITPEQAKQLLPLWQALLSLTGSDTTAEAELTALQDQVVQTMTSEQLQAIAAMQIT